ncbi:uncharacterized protein Z518_00990 [Rhinocladiella mackenziei CBS 650.93]|uniref:Uncharacterized protein n=1 Tax=Rhinocladiella mackenziei CBS 650.93 TaxID=1442369 RepID=A0A0D2IUZ6_9EURO|nr:uncharacterized protein Z518_00990 [Rhinocladiella mackenziei CBS 650.93]KIX09909.1 hypothetical protein Z518_00990 [Rhinocladiella mackenziei CBS 650.93]
MAAHHTVPVLLCGRREDIASVVMAELRPKYEVVQCIMSPDDGLINLPLTLSGSKPRNPESNLGSRDFSRTPRAVVLGGGYDDATVEMLRKTVTETKGARKVPWLKADQGKTAAGPPPGSEGYPVSVATRVKESLDSLEKEGKLEGNEDGIFTW